MVIEMETCIKNVIGTLCITLTSRSMSTIPCGWPVCKLIPDLMREFYELLEPPIFIPTDLHPLGNAGSLKQLRIDHFEKPAPFFFKTNGNKWYVFKIV